MRHAGRATLSARAALVAEYSAANAEYERSYAALRDDERTARAQVMSASMALREAESRLRQAQAAARNAQVRRDDRLRAATAELRSATPRAIGRAIDEVERRVHVGVEWQRQFVDASRVNDVRAVERSVLAALDELALGPLDDGPALDVAIEEALAPLAALPGPRAVAA